MSPLLAEEPSVTEIPALSAPRQPGREYVPFGNMESRNGLQERIEIPLMLRALRVPRGGRVLEVGCGRGVALPVFSRRLEPRELIALDVDRSLVDIARERASRERVPVTIYEADVRAIPLESASVDLVIDFGTCYHVGGGVEGARLAISEIARVLRPGGLFVHETPIAQHLAHPVRSFAKSLPWRSVPALAFDRAAVLWAARRKRSHW